jgi:tetrahydromethanopterin S-methyltransferase subunit B
MDPLESAFSQVRLQSHPDRGRAVRVAAVLGGTVQDLLFIGLTIVAFVVLWLLVKGVERFER